MAIFHSTTKIIGRAAARSAVAAAAYRSGEKITNERDGIIHDYTRKRGIEYSEIMLPENAPEEYKNRDILWNTVEQIEKRKDAQLAREIELGLPAELDRQSQIELLRDYIQENFVKKGMCADFSLHDKGDGNPHAHIMLTTRSVTPEGFGKKERSWNDWQNVENWREAWANNCNREFEKFGIDERIDHRSYAEQGIEREPTIHLGSAAHQLEKRGIQTERGDINREVQSVNREIEEIKDKLVAAFAEQQEIEAAPMGAELPPAVENPAAPRQDNENNVIVEEFVEEQEIETAPMGAELLAAVEGLLPTVEESEAPQQDNENNVTVNKKTRYQREKELNETVNTYNFIKKNDITTFSGIDSKLEALGNEISETEAKISELNESKKDVGLVIWITEQYFQTKERLASEDTPENRQAFQSVRKQLIKRKFKDLPDLEALKIEREKLNNEIKSYKATKSEKEDLYKGLSRVVAGRQAQQSRGAAAPTVATSGEPIKKLSIKEQIAAAEAKAAIKNAERITTNIPKKRDGPER